MVHDRTDTLSEHLQDPRYNSRRKPLPALQASHLQRRTSGQDSQPKRNGEWAVYKAIMAVTVNGDSMGGQSARQSEKGASDVQTLAT